MTATVRLTPGDIWLSKGGAIAVANIRGGGEFGPRWHQAALKQNRQKAFDDFAAVAKDLADPRFHRCPKHIGIVGASNGGVLTTVTMTQHPELLRAVVCQRPLIDMLRYTQFGAGASWVDEYGDPDKPDERAYIEKYSRLSEREAGREISGHPVHHRNQRRSRDADLGAHDGGEDGERQGHDVLFNESAEGGHGPGSTNAAQAEMWALSYTYLAQRLGIN